MKKEEYPILLNQKGVGRYLGKVKTNLGVVGEYSSYVQLYLINENEYSVEFFTNPFKRRYFEKCLYYGKDKNKAEKKFNEIIEKDKKLKENSIHRFFSRN